MRRHALPLTALLGAALGLLSALFLAPPAAAAEAPLALLTIVDGDVTVVRDAQKFEALEGLALQADDIVQTGDGTRLVRIELADGAALDLGPGTGLLLRPRYAEAGDRPAQLYLAQGWAKLSGRGTGLASAHFDLGDVRGVAVLRIAGDAASAFVESGSARIVDRGDTGAAPPAVLSEGQAYARTGTAAGSAMARPGGALLNAMPRAFADTLPRRAARFRDRWVTPAKASDIAYADVAAWINAERALRPGFVQRWKSKARDPQFRPSLVADLRAHPEWDRVLFPERYLPKRKPVAHPSAAARPPNPDRLGEPLAAAAPAKDLP